MELVDTGLGISWHRGVYIAMKLAHISHFILWHRGVHIAMELVKTRHCILWHGMSILSWN
jgi:hypothetical protein